MRMELKALQDEYIMGMTIHGLIQKQALKTPNGIAVEFKNSRITYRDLCDRADILAAILRKSELSINPIVGVVANRSIDMLVSILAVLKAGGAYLPVDHEYPKDRINYMLEDSNAEIVISQRVLENKIEYNGRMLFLDDIDFNGRSDLHICEIGDDSSLAYVIYTSGSTGKPKGVMIEHRSVINFIDGICNVIDFSERKRILALTTISFDIFLLETLLALAQGLTVVLADRNEQNNPKLLTELLINSRIDMLQMTPSRMQLLINHDKELNGIKYLKEIMIGGEVFPQSLLEKIKSHTNARIYNMYGPTETTVWSTVSDLSGKNSIDIGKPIINTQIYIIDINNNLAKDGSEGELCIGGRGLARGYLNKPDLTAERFISNPFIPGERIYRTGDFAKRLPDGNLEYVGRVDNQVKIRGHRIELGEIETALLNYKSIRQAAVTSWQGKENNNYLCAYFVSDEEMAAPGIREYLSGFLPDYMVPAFFIRLDNIPQTPNGKIDRKSLPDPKTVLVFGSQQKEDQHEEKSDDVIIETRIREIIKENIGVPISTDSIDIDCNLLELGLNSISFIESVVAIEVEFDIQFRDEDLDYNKFSTLRSLISYIKSRRIDK